MPPYKVGETIEFLGKTLVFLKLLGNGKGGYSYLVEGKDGLFVLKQIHHEPCSYYSFGDKLAAERHDYQRLMDAGITIPKMLGIDEAGERILKEYIDGPTIFDLVRLDQSISAYLPLIEEEANKAKKAGINIDYFPTNFVAKDGKLYYVDYECNDYDPKWDFEHWGKQYWSKTQAFFDYLKTQH